MRMENDAVLDSAASLTAERKPFALITVVRAVSPTSAKPGAKAIIEADGVIQGWIGGGCAQPAVIKMAKKVLKEGQARLIRISPTKDGYVEEGITNFGMACHSGGTLDIFIDPVIARPILLLIGASPAAQALVGLAQRVGFSVTAAFPGADSQMFPEADNIIDGFDVADIVPNFVIVATQGKCDEQGLEAAITTGADYIGFIASKTKSDKLKNYLKESGGDVLRVDAIISPIGLKIDAVTPEEIALSILAGLVKARRQAVAIEEVQSVSCCGGTSQEKTKSSKENSNSNPEKSCCEGSSDVEITAIDTVCGMSVAVKGAGFQSKYKDKD